MKCGAVWQTQTVKMLSFWLPEGKFVDINNKIIPIFKAHSIQGIKQLDYQDFCEIATLIGEGKHITTTGIAKIKLIKDRMNTKRK